MKNKQIYILIKFPDAIFKQTLSVILIDNRRFCSTLLPLLQKLKFNGFLSSDFMQLAQNQAKYFLFQVHFLPLLAKKEIMASIFL